MEFLAEYGMFLAKAVTLVLAILFVAGSLGATAVRRRDQDDPGEIRVRHMNQELDALKEGINHAIMVPHKRKAALKLKRKEDKAKKKAASKKSSSRKEADHESKPRLFVLDFEGDVRASATDNLRREVTAILQVADEKDEVVVRLESPGGMVHSYGFASSQLKRVREHGIHLTICVDKVAASGGYMMACIGERILAAPFAVVGSIGVVAQIPNFHRLLKRNHVDFELLTAGEYKRTLTMFGENTDKGREKFQEEIEDTHNLFKEFVSQNRDSLDIAQVATGEHWFGARALEMGLIDELKTSDEYLVTRAVDSDVYEVSWHHKQKLAERLGFHVDSVLERVLERWFHRGSQRFPQ